MYCSGWSGKRSSQVVPTESYSYIVPTGPVIYPLADRYPEYRRAGIWLGAAIAGASLFAASFVTNVLAFPDVADPASADISYCRLLPSFYFKVVFMVSEDVRIHSHTFCVYDSDLRASSLVICPLYLFLARVVRNSSRFCKWSYICWYVTSFS